MPHVVFEKPFYFYPTPSCLQVFEILGVPMLVTTQCADKAIAEGAAKPVTKSKPSQEK